MDNRLIIISGDPFYRKESKRILDSLLPSSYSEVILSSPSENDLNRECFSNSLFKTFKFIRVEDFSYKKVMEPFFVRFLGAGSVSSLVLIEEPDTDKAQTLKKKFSELGLEDKVECLFLCDMKPKEKAKFVQKHAVEVGVKIDIESSELLLELCNDNLSIVHEELSKLKLLFGSDVTNKQIMSVVSPIVSSKDAVQFYVSLMGGNPVQSISVARQINNDEGYEIILGCLVRLSYLVLLLHYVNGNDKALMDFLKKKRTPLNLKWTSNDTEDVVSKSGPPPSLFMMRVAKKLYDRVGSRSFWAKLFTQCYESYVSYRMNANESQASAEIEKAICLISRS